MDTYETFLETLGPDGWRGLMCCVLVVGIVARGVAALARSRKSR